MGGNNENQEGTIPRRQPSRVTFAGKINKHIMTLGRLDILMTVIGYLKVEAHTFYGRLGPWAFTNWLC